MVSRLGTKQYRCDGRHMYRAALAFRAGTMAGDVHSIRGTALDRKVNRYSIGAFLMCTLWTSDGFPIRSSILTIERSDHVASLPRSPESSPRSLSPSTPEKSKWRLPPFVPEFDITRGVLYAAQSFVKILLMLAVMSVFEDPVSNLV